MSDNPKPMFYAGPYVPSGVIYWSGNRLCKWLIPGFDPNPGIHKIDVYETDYEYLERIKAKINY